MILDEQGNTQNLSQIDDLPKALNTTWIQKVRQSLINGTFPETCKRCEREENSGIQSTRLTSNRISPSLLAELQKSGRLESTPSDLISLEIRFGNLCNLKCRMCNPYASSKWIGDWEKIHGPSEEINQLKKIDWFKQPKTWDNLKSILPSLEMIYITGGEPLLIKEQIALLKACVEEGHASRIQLNYHTNLTRPPDEFVQYWKHFRKVSLFLSVDGVGKIDEYIRAPMDWPEGEKNLAAFDQVAKQFPNIQPEIHMCYQAYNAFEIPQLFELLKNYPSILQIPYINLLDRPNNLNIRILPAEVKAEVKDSILSYLEQNRNQFDHHHPAINKNLKKVTATIEYMLAEDWTDLLPSFWQVTEQMDRVRQQSAEDTIPWLKRMRPPVKGALTEERI